MNRGWILWPALAASAALVVFSDPPAGDAVVAPPAATSRHSVGAAGPAAPAAPARRSATLSDEVVPIAPLVSRAVLYPPSPAQRRVDLFASRVASPSAPASPTIAIEAPPFPFSVAGRKHDGANWEVFLTKDGLSYVVKAGDTLEQDYRVQQIGPTQMTVVYVPLAIEQVISIGEAE